MSCLLFDQTILRSLYFRGSFQVPYFSFLSIYAFCRQKTYCNNLTFFFHFHYVPVREYSTQPSVCEKINSLGELSSDPLPIFKKIVRKFVKPIDDSYCLQLFDEFLESFFKRLRTYLCASIQHSFQFARRSTLQGTVLPNGVKVAV